MVELFFYNQIQRYNTAFVNGQTYRTSFQESKLCVFLGRIKVYNEGYPRSIGSKIWILVHAARIIPAFTQSPGGNNYINVYTSIYAEIIMMSSRPAKTVRPLQLAADSNLEVWGRPHVLSVLGSPRFFLFFFFVLGYPEAYDFSDQLKWKRFV